VSSDNVEQDNNFRVIRFMTVLQQLRIV